MSTKPTDGERDPNDGEDDDVDIDLEFDTYTAQYQNNNNYHTDADSIRREFSISQYDRSVYEYLNAFPDMIEHVWDGEPRGATSSKGGTDGLIRGKPGTGKSKWLIHLALRLIEINNEKVVWRGSTTRSEWLPLAPWVRLCLPASAKDVSAVLVPKDPTDDRIEVDIEDVAREVVYYDGPEQLNRELLKQGQIHVVYPDGAMTGCQKIYQNAPEKQYEDLEFTPDDPAKHWWFAWILSRIEDGPHDWTSLILDEIGDLAPQMARKDEYSTYQKIELLKDCFVDARKFGLSLFLAGHTEQDIHQMVRHKIRWRIQMPGESNPVSKSDVVGFNSVPMETDFMSHAPVGQILVYNQQNFEELAYPNYPSPIDYTLRVELTY
jgi:hypothetical protein